MRNDKWEKRNDKWELTIKKNNIIKDGNIKKLIEEPKEIKSRDWTDKNKFKEILAIIDSNNLITRIK